LACEGNGTTGPDGGSCGQPDGGHGVGGGAGGSMSMTPVTISVPAGVDDGSEIVRFCIVEPPT